jgi:membrane-bound lytic murein transglycosylase
MKSHLQLGAAAILMFQLLIAGNAVAQDQSSDTSQAGGQTQQQGPLASLSTQDKMKYLKARQQVLANNPDLKAEQEDITKQRQGIQNASPDDKKAFLQNFMAFQKKMKEAMLQVDPSLGPVFDQIDQEMKQKFQQRAAQAGGN